MFLKKRKSKEVKCREHIVLLKLKKKKFIFLLFRILRFNIFMRVLGFDKKFLKTFNDVIKLNFDILVGNVLNIIVYLYFLYNKFIKVYGFEHLVFIFKRMSNVLIYVYKFRILQFLKRLNIKRKRIKRVDMERGFIWKKDMRKMKIGKKKKIAEYILTKDLVYTKEIEGIKSFLRGLYFMIQ